jgi:predicted DNA-binding transcriptional regulator AlpA
MRKEQCLERVIGEVLAYTPKELASLLGKSPSWLYEQIAAGRLPRQTKIGGASLWPAAEIKLWLAAGCPPRHEWERLKEEAKQKVLTDAAMLPNMN